MDYSFYSTNKHFTEIERNVLDYVSRYPEDIKKLTIQTLADETFTSKSTIFRLAKKLGFNGYTDMIYHLSSQQDRQAPLKLFSQLTHFKPYIPILSNNLL